MQKTKKVCGIDVSKETLDIFYLKDDKKVHKKIGNDNSGFKYLIETLGKKYTYVMENTGVYSLNCAIALKKASADVRVESPVIIKRFIQMKLERHKTDKKDAEWIYHYGMEQEPKVFEAPTKEKIHLTQLLRSIEHYKKHLRMFKNVITGMELYPLQHKLVEKSLSKSKSLTEDAIEKLEKALNDRLEVKYGELKANLATIPGLGNTAISYLIVLTDGFDKFKTHSQLICFAGLSPRQYVSGSSVFHPPRISKMGNRIFRRTLYMCAISAVRCNPACKELFTRLKEKNKKGKIALVAACNKLLKQAFAIAKSGKPFDKDHVSAMPLKIDAG